MNEKTVKIVPKMLVLVRHSVEMGKLKLQKTVKTVPKMLKCVKKVFVETGKLKLVLEKNVMIEQITGKIENVQSLVLLSSLINHFVETGRLMNEKTVKIVHKT